MEETARVRVDVVTFMPDSARIPKLVEVFDESLRAVRSDWYESNHIEIGDLPAGMYTLRLSTSSGIQQDETFELEGGQNKDIMIDISSISPHESHEWAYFNKSFSINPVRGTDMKAIEYYRQPGIEVKAKVWRYTGGSWTEYPLHEFNNQLVFADGNVFHYSTGDVLSLLEISGKEMQNLYVSLPPGNHLKCLVKPAEGADDQVYPIDVTVATEHYKAETLLTLLTNGAVARAKRLSNAEEAERLLYEKMVNPVTAAIGGYFLLKTDELERLHDWANNLANWFPWLPDGAIIHATQLLSKKDKTEADIQMIRTRLLGAASEGIPVYSEGLRLLEKGLTQLWYHSDKGDEEVGNARKRIGSYAAVVDWSQETTTFTGISPTAPGIPMPLPLK
ncbi:hypothetical protein [Dyadobacter beijingensis]|nr:hypothetical protein [Dyadobacter beijingensis]